MTLSARARSVGGTSSPRALAVFRLITSSYLVGACTGRSAGFSPRRTWSLRRNDGSYAASRLCVFGRGLRFALRFFSACNPRPSNLHQYRFVLFRCSLRQTVAFCRVLPEEVSVTVHDTFHLFGCSNVPSCKPGTLRTVPVEMNFADGTKAAIRRLSRALMGRNGERRNGKA
jgi:hypothetical protein